MKSKYYPFFSLRNFIFNFYVRLFYNHYFLDLLIYEFLFWIDILFNIKKILKNVYSLIINKVYSGLLFVSLLFWFFVNIINTFTINTFFFFVLFFIAKFFFYILCKRFYNEKSLGLIIKNYIKGYTVINLSLVISFFIGVILYKMSEEIIPLVNHINYKEIAVVIVAITIIKGIFFLMDKLMSIDDVKTIKKPLEDDNKKKNHKSRREKGLKQYKEQRKNLFYFQ